MNCAELTGRCTMDNRPWNVCSNLITITVHISPKTMFRPWRGKIVVHFLPQNTQDAELMLVLPSGSAWWRHDVPFGGLSDVPVLVGSQPPASPPQKNWNFGLTNRTFKRERQTPNTYNSIRCRSWRNFYNMNGPAWVVPRFPQQIQDGGRRPYRVDVSVSTFWQAWEQRWWREWYCNWRTVRWWPQEPLQ